MLRSSLISWRLILVRCPVVVPTPCTCTQVSITLLVFQTIENTGSKSFAFFLHLHNPPCQPIVQCLSYAWIAFSNFPPEFLSSVARCGYFPPKWRFWKAGGLTKVVAYSHHFLAYFGYNFGFLWLLLATCGFSHTLWLNCGLFVALNYNLWVFKAKFFSPTGEVSCFPHFITNNDCFSTFIARYWSNFYSLQNIIAFLVVVKWLICDFWWLYCLKYGLKVACFGF